MPWVQIPPGTRLFLLSFFLCISLSLSVACPLSGSSQIFADFPPKCLLSYAAWGEARKYDKHGLNKNYTTMLRWKASGSFLNFLGLQDFGLGIRKCHLSTKPLQTWPPWCLQPQAGATRWRWTRTWGRSTRRWSGVQWSCWHTGNKHE